MNKTTDGWWMEIDSQTDIDKLEGFKETKKHLAKLANVPLPGEDYFEQMHDQIMAKIEHTQIKTFRVSLWKRKQGIKRGLAAASLLAAVALIGIQTEPGQMTSSADVVLSDAVQKSPDIDTTILTFKNKDDFFVDLAQENLDHIPAMQAALSN